MRILSLDIGSHAIKAVELDVTFGRVELADYLIEPLVSDGLVPVDSLGAAEKTESQPAGGEKPEAAAQAKMAPQMEPRHALSEAQRAAIARLVANRQPRYDRLVVNIPKGWTTTRIFSFPTRDRKAIQSSLAFELEDEIPFSVENIIYDFAILPAEGPGSTVFTAVALRSDLMSLISDLQPFGLDPDVITIDNWGFSQLLKRAVPKEFEGQPVCVVNLGCHQTSIHVFNGSDPSLVHISSVAGADVTRAIANNYHLTQPEAEKAKIDGGFLVTDTHWIEAPKRSEPITEEQKSFSDVIENALAPALREIKQTLISYKSQFKTSPRAVFLTGGTSLIPNLRLRFEEQLKIPVYEFSYLSRLVGQTLRLSEASEAQISTAVGTALTAVKLERNLTINLRKEIFAKRSGLSAMNLSALKKPLKYAGATLGFIYLNLAVQSMILSSRASKQDGQLERAIKSVLGATSPSVIATYKNSPTTLKAAVKKELDKYKDMQAPQLKPQLSAFEVLNKVSAAMPKDMKLDVSVFEVKDGKLRLEGMVDQLTNSARIAKALEETRLVVDVKKEKADEDPKTKKVKFQFSAKLAEAGGTPNADPGPNNPKTH